MLRAPTARLRYKHDEQRPGVEEHDAIHPIRHGGQGGRRPVLEVTCRIQCMMIRRVSLTPTYRQDGHQTLTAPNEISLFKCALIWISAPGRGELLTELF
jgi:hypothetical protein